jgi:two-component system nitrogen regulation sensor histidine kinase GlnL
MLLEEAMQQCRFPGVGFPKSISRGDVLTRMQHPLAQRHSSMKELFFSIDRELRLLAWPEGIAEYTGRRAADLIGKKYYDVFPRIYLSDRDAVAEAAGKKQALSLEGYVLPCLYGHMTADLMIEPVVSRSGSVDEIKVTVRPYAPCAVAKKLNDSQRLIDIGKVASTLAHGVRNPLNAIKGAVVYLREKYDYEAPLIEFTKIMEEEISRLESFISRFLSTSLSDAERTPTDVNALLEKIRVLTAFQLSTSNIKPVFEFGDLPLVTVNSFHVEQAVLNVINNAIEAMSGGGRLVVKTFTETRADTPCIVIAVSDTGAGITDPPGGGHAERTKDKGKGFGLFIAYEVLKYYGGHLEIESMKNEGTAVRLYLPLQGPPAVTS